MAIKQLNSGLWSLDFWPNGRAGSRVRKTFRTKRECEQYEIQEKAKAQQGLYVVKKKDKRRLSDLALEWFNEHGHSLSSGKNRLSELQGVIKDLGDPMAQSFTAQDFLGYRRERLEARRAAGFEPENDLNHKLAYVKAMFNTLLKSGSWTLPHPLKNTPKLPMQERTLAFLSLEQISALLLALEESRNTDVLMLTKICLSTGSRWGEASGLTASDIHNGKIHLGKTKNKRNRSIPISRALEVEILSGRPRTGNLFGGSWAAFKLGAERAGIELPRGQKAHVLRHTFASHFMMNGGNLLTLNKILGHQTIQMTMRYAHLAPEHLAEAVTLNPLAVKPPKRAAA